MAYASIPLNRCRPERANHTEDLDQQKWGDKDRNVARTPVLMIMMSGNALIQR